MKEENMVMSRSTRIYKMIITALFVALVYTATRLINIPLPIPGAGGLVHLGNVPVYIAAILFGSRIGAIAGSFGMALFDLTSGWTIWAPFTFMTLWIEGYVVGVITRHKKGKMQIFLAMCAALIVKCAGYYIAEVILFHNFITPLFSISANVTQVVTAGVITFVLVPVLSQLRE